MDTPAYEQVVGQLAELAKDFRKRAVNAKTGLERSRWLERVAVLDSSLAALEECARERNVVSAEGR